MSIWFDYKLFRFLNIFQACSVSIAREAAMKLQTLLTSSTMQSLFLELATAFITCVRDRQVRFLLQFDFLYQSTDVLLHYWNSVEPLSSVTWSVNKRLPSINFRYREKWKTISNSLKAYDVPLMIIHTRWFTDLAWTLIIHWKGTEELHGITQNKCFINCILKWAQARIETTYSVTVSLLLSIMRLHRVFNYNCL